MASSTRSTFMDFETVNPAIPRFPGMRPYDQTAVSVVGARAEGARSGTRALRIPSHRHDRSPARVHRFAMLCPWQERKHRWCTAAFESQRLSELAAWLPEFAGRIKKIQRRLWDLLPVIRNHVYHPAFAGSYSLKNVLPALVPGMTYEGMEVADGRTPGWPGSRSCGAAWIRPSGTGSGRRCWTIAGRTRWRWSDCWRSFDRPTVEGQYLRYVFHAVSCAGD